MTTRAGALLLLPLLIAGCTDTSFPPVSRRATAAQAGLADRIAGIEASWSAAGGSRLARPLGDPGPSAVSAAWWGFDTEDSTSALQAALDSDAQVVVVPRMTSPWVISRPLEIWQSELEILLEPGVELVAAAGAFRGPGECLISSEYVSGVSLIGYGATLRMQKRDYQAAPYERGEWRHAISLRTVSHFLIAGLTISNAGGDGVYVGTSHSSPCEDVVLRDLDILDSYRQGISVISARHLLVENCVISGTSGTQPMAGIDFEPNSYDSGFQDCVVTRCRIERNAGPGILLVLSRLDRRVPPVSIRIQDTTVHNLPVAAWLHGLDNHVRGTLTVSGCSFFGIAWLKGSPEFSVVYQKSP